MLEIWARNQWVIHRRVSLRSYFLSGCFMTLFCTLPPGELFYSLAWISSSSLRPLFENLSRA